MPPNMEWKCYSLVFLFRYELSIFTMFSLKNVRKQSSLLSKSSILLAEQNIRYL